MPKVTFKMKRLDVFEKKRIKVGENACMADSTLGMSFMLPDTGFHVICQHQNKKYEALKCHYAGECAFQEEIEKDDAEEFPDLFIKD